MEDTGWYKANYTALYGLNQNPVQWGKGKQIKTVNAGNNYILMHLFSQGWVVLS